MSDDLTRFYVPQGGGVEEHPSGRLYLKEEVDAALERQAARIRELETEPAALREGAQGVAVKRLEWEQGHDGPRFEYSTNGEYQVYYTGSNAETILTFGARRVFLGRFSGDVIGKKARHAAQADYERRIRSALTPALVSVEEAARTIMRSKDARDTAFDAMWAVAENHSLEATNSGGARYSITGDVVNELYYAALRALAGGE